MHLKRAEANMAERRIRKVFKAEQVEKHYAWLRSKVFEGYDTLEQLDNGGLSKLLLAGKITGFQVVQIGRDVEQKLKGTKFRVMLLENEKNQCLRELRAKGFTYLG